MVEHIKQQLAAQGANVGPRRTSGRGAANSSAGAKKSTKKDHSDELTSQQIQAARREVVGVGLLAWENPIFGLPCYYRKYRLTDKAQAAAMDKEFYRVTGTEPT
jgi:hypothetical protein